MVGLLPLFDPPRHDTKETIDECLKKGISVKMVTGGTATLHRTQANTDSRAKDSKPRSL